MLLFGVVTVLTVLLVAVGIQVFFILRDLKKALEKINKILEDASFVSQALSRPVAGISSFVEGLKGLRDLVDFVSQKQQEKALPEGQGESLEEPRFFHRDGKPLTS